MAFLGVYGHVNLDHILQMDRLPAPETTVPVTKTLVRLGGTGGNIARAAAALGVPTALAACVGDDFLPEHRKQLESGGIDLTDLRSIPGGTPKVWILSVPGGPQSAIIDQGVMGDGVTRPSLDLAWLTSDWVHFTTGAPEDWIRVAKQAHAAKKQIAFDPAQEIHYRYPSRTLQAMLEMSDVVYLNASELQRALSLLGYGDATQLLDHTDRVVITRGSAGVELLHKGDRIKIPACPLRGVTAAETTGAGDVFRAGVYAGLHRKQPWPKALQTACVASSLFLEAHGARFPVWSAVEERLREWNP